MKLTIKDKRKFNLIFWGIFITPFLSLIIIFIIAANGGLGYMPDFAELENPKIDLATQIISEDGKTLGNFYFQNRNRTYVEYQELSKNLIDALIATEDYRFYKHSGIDFKGTLRAFLLFGARGGGSTITQQFAKLLFHDRSKTLVERLGQKIKEYIIAVRLERAYTKEELITMYFNQIDFLHNAVGINSAANVYFNTSPDSLKTEQGAVIVGMAKNPSLYNPKLHYEWSLARRNVVLGQMEKYGFIEREVYDSLSAMPLELDFQRISHNYGLATYFREFLRLTMSKDIPNRRDYYSYDIYKRDSALWADNPLFGWCNKNRKPNGDNYDLLTDGLKIYTTINSKMQNYAERAVNKHLGEYLQPAFFREKKGKTYAPFSNDLTRREINEIMRRAILNSEHGRSLKKQGLSYDSIYRVFKKPVPMTVFSYKGDIDTVMSPYDSILYYKHFLRSGFMAMDPVTGYVRAYVGGIDFRYFKYDHVTQGKRQAGSTFKPFLYILAIQEGYSPCYKVPNVSVKFDIMDSIWIPRSMSDPEDLGQERTLRWGLARSENNISAWLVKRFKPQPIVDVAHKMGIESYIDPVYSMIYGTSDMSVEEMVSSYATFANKGIHTDPVYVTRIEDKNGNILTTFHPERNEAIDENTAYLMLKLMEGVTAKNLGEGHRRFGTAASIRYGDFMFTGEIAGKTGTTQNFSDGWFIGITPRLVAGGWVGCEDRSAHFNSYLGTGSSAVLPIWAYFMKQVYFDSSLGVSQEDRFEPPENFNYLLDCETTDNYAKFPDFADEEIFD
ncbi:MAG: transglycosylase domain-containing protein [Bacteroidales bacterium]|nr:transglycosylase domain-containing protein [Bacteroidales bacterium]